MGRSSDGLVLLEYQTPKNDSGYNREIRQGREQRMITLRGYHLDT